MGAEYGSGAFKFKKIFEGRVGPSLLSGLAFSTCFLHGFFVVATWWLGATTWSLAGRFSQFKIFLTFDIYFWAVPECMWKLDLLSLTT
jgi:hypothetical protein